MTAQSSYLKVRWSHELPDEPVLLFSELNGARWETRKVEVLRDGSQGYASLPEDNGRSMLSVEPIPSLVEIAADPQFEPELISASEFEEVWAGRQGRYGLG